MTDSWPIPASDRHLLELSSLKGRHRSALAKLKGAETKEEMESVRHRLAHLTSEILRVSKL